MSDQILTKDLQPTLPFGSNDGVEFNGLDKFDYDGIKDMNSRSPIQQMAINVDNDLHMISGLSVDYRGPHDKPLNVTGGYLDYDNCDWITFSPHEYISSVSLKVGFNSHYEVNTIIQLTFFIGDKRKPSGSPLRKVGPFGATDAYSHCDSYEINQEIFAFGGYQAPQWGKTDTKIIGLYFMVQGGASSPYDPGLDPRSTTYNATAISHSRKIMLTPPRKKQYYNYPDVAYGLYSLHLSGLSNIGVASEVRYIQTDLGPDENLLKAAINALDNAGLYAGGINIADIRPRPEIRFGTCPYQEPNALGYAPFSVFLDGQVSGVPKVICWLTGFDLDRNHSWRIKTTISSITTRDFNVEVAPTYDSVLKGASISWIAVSSDAIDIAIGTFEADSRSQTGHVDFEHKLSGTPEVICALNGMNFGNDNDLIFKASINNVTSGGFDYTVKMEDEGRRNHTTFSYIAYIKHAVPPSPDPHNFDVRSAFFDTIYPNVEQTIPLAPPRAVDGLPNIVHGLYHLDIDHKHEIQVCSTTEGVEKDSFKAAIQSQLHGTQINAGGINCIDLPAGGAIQGGVLPFQSTNGQKKVTLGATFERKFSQEPTVIVWLTGFEMDKSYNWRIESSAPTVSLTGFTVDVDAWQDSVLRSIGISWIAIPADAENVATGTFMVKDADGFRYGWIDFERELPGTPIFVYALCHIDFGCENDIILKPTVDEITSKGFHYSALMGEGDRKSTVSATIFNYIAIVPLKV